MGFARKTGTIGVLLAFLALGAFSEIPPAAGEERILDFQSRLECGTDASVQVEEVIRVHSEGISIRHGIYRDLSLKNWAGRPSRLEVLETLLDGKPTQARQDLQGQSTRLYLGDSSRTLEKGTHVFTLRYRMDNQVGNLADRDEIYWNVTGNDWAFPIEKATCLVSLPGALDPARLEVAAYTGRRGSRESDASFSRQGTGLFFSTTRTLYPGEGLTVAVGWPKGFVAFGSLREKNPGWITFLAGMGLVVLYYFLAWLAVGRDAPRGLVIPRFEPPEGMTPSQVRRIARMGLDTKGLAAEILDLAVKGILRIRETEERFSLLMEPRPDFSRLPAHQENLAAGLLSIGMDSSRRIESLKAAARQKGLKGKLARLGMSLGRIRETAATPGEQVEIRLDGTDSKAFHSAWTAFRRRIEASDPAKKLFSKNTGIWILGLLGSMGTIAAMLFSNHPRAFLQGGGAFLALWLSFWTIGVVLLVGAALAAWASALSSRSCAKTAGALFLTLFSLPFLGAEIFVLVTLSRISFTPLFRQLLPALLLVLATTGTFRYLLRRYTKEGQEAMDAIEGYRQYLTLAEKDRLRSISGPTPTPALFEKHLPFAMALDVEEAWTSQFTAILGQGYHPVWIEGTSMTGSSGFSSRFPAAFAGAVSSSGSSSGGSGGGGSSGGGGGGGGGGGW